MSNNNHCIHLGEELRREVCRTCTGHVEVKVFRCRIHRLCSLSKPVYQITPGRYRVCEGCPDRPVGNPWIHVHIANPQLD